MKYLLTSLFLIGVLSMQAQTLDEINESRFRHSMNGSIVLTSWAGANIVSGAIGFALTPSGEWKHFHEMNIYWNLVNLGLGIPGLLAKQKKEMGLSFEQTVKKVNSTKTIYLANGILDVAYITTGFLFREIGNRNSQDINFRNRMVGYGNSIIMQGAFLLFFDFVEFGVHTINGKRLDAHWKKISLRPYGAFGAGLNMTINLNTPKTEVVPTFSLLSQK